MLTHLLNLPLPASLMFLNSPLTLSLSPYASQGLKDLKAIVHASNENFVFAEPFDVPNQFKIDIFGLVYTCGHLMHFL